MKKSHIDSKYDDIVKAAVQLFARKGIEGTTVKDIGREAGVTDAAIYKHFKSKDDVALAVFAHYCDLYTRLVDHHRKTGGSFASRLNALVSDFLDHHDEDRFGLLLLSQRHEVFSRLGKTHRLPIVAMTEFIQSGVDAGDIPAQSARVTAALLIGAFTRLAVFSDLGGLPSLLRPLASEIQARIHGLVGLG